MLYAFGAVATWVAISLLLAGERRLLMRRLLPAVAVTAVLSGLAYAPIVAASGLASLVDNEFVRSLAWTEFADELPDSLRSTWDGWNRDVPLPITVALVAGFATALLFHRRLARIAMPPALAALAFIAPVVVAQRVVPFERVWLFLLPLYLITAAAGILFLLRPLATRVGGEAVSAHPCRRARRLARRERRRNAVRGRVGGHLHVPRRRARRRPARPRATSRRQGPRRPPADAILEYDLRRRGLDPAALLYWQEPGATGRFLVVVKEGPDDYPLADLRADPRLEGVRLRSARHLRRFDEASVYEVLRAG